MVENITQIVNDAYVVGEAGMWLDPNQQRTNAAEMLQLVEGGSVILVYAHPNIKNISPSEMLAPSGSVMCNVHF